MASLLLLLRLFSEAASAASASRSSIHDFVGDGAGAIPLGNYVEATASALGNTIFLRIEKSRKGRLLLRFEHKWPRGSSRLRLFLRTRFKSDAKLVVTEFYYGTWQFQRKRSTFKSKLALAGLRPATARGCV